MEHGEFDVEFTATQLFEHVQSTIFPGRQRSSVFILARLIGRKSDLKVMVLKQDAAH